ncbi:MAG: DivIVA domain-containing protein [Ruminococcus sp.]
MLTIDEIKDVKFRTNRGQSFYKAEDVDAFIDEVIETLEMKNNEKAELVHKMDILATRIEQYRSDEETVRNALLSAQKVADSTLKEANEQSEVSLKNAKEKADKMIADAQKEVAKEKEALVALQKLANEMRSELFMKVKNCIDIVDALPSEGVVDEIKEKLNKEFPTPVADAVAKKEEPEEIKLSEPVAVKEESVVVEDDNDTTVSEPVTEATTKFGVLKFGSNYDVEE